MSILWKNFQDILFGKDFYVCAVGMYWEFLQGYSKIKE